MLLILPLVRKGRRFFICAKAMSHAQTRQMTADVSSLTIGWQLDWITNC